jgi:hypothetical protein
MSSATITPAPLHSVSTTEGPIDLPIRYWDGSAAVALFTVPAPAARALVEPLGVQPVRLPGDRALVGVMFNEYRRTSVGPYNEVGVTVVCAPPDAPAWRILTDPLRRVRSRRLGWAVVDLPVTTPQADVAGREIWGYPKFVTDIAVRFRRSAFHGQVADPADGTPIVTLEGALGTPLPMPAMDAVTYTRHHDVPWRTVIDVRGPFRCHLASRLLLRVGPSAHPMTGRLRALGLDGATPVVVLVTSAWRSLLHEGVPA